MVPQPTVAVNPFNANNVVVGQFNKGRMKVYKNQGGGKLATGEWLMAEGAIAEVPDVW